MKTTLTQWMSGLCAAGALCALSACGGSKSYTIEGTVSGDFLTYLNPNERVVYVVSFDRDTLGSATIDADGHFTLTGTIDAPILAYADVQAMPEAVFVLEPGHIQMDWDEEAHVSGTDGNDALNEFFTLSDDLEHYYVSKLYAQPDTTDENYSEETAAALFNETLNGYFQAMIHLTDSIYNENQDNPVGLYASLLSIQSMSSSAEVRAKFGDNDYIMNSGIVQHIMEELDNPTEPEYDVEGLDEGDLEESNEPESDDDAAER